MPLRYVMGPFEFASDIAFPELNPAGLSERACVRIRRVDTLAEAVQDGLSIDEGCTASRDEYLLEIPGVARFHVLHGNEVRFLPAPEAQERDIRLYLLGSIFGVLCHQNGYLPLHASAVAASGGVTAFLADSGVGKSTLAAFLGRRGFTVVADDICLLPPAGDGLRVIPVGGWLKLWQSSLEALGEQRVEEHRVVSHEDKFRLYLANGHERADERYLKLDRIIFLERPSGDAKASPELALLAAPVALARLMDATYNAYLLHCLGLEGGLFQRCAQIVSEVKAYRLLAPWGWDAMPALLDLLEEELRPPSEAAV